MPSEFETTTVRREPDAIVTEHQVARREDSSWALWVAGIAVFLAVLVIALFMITRNNGAADADTAALTAEAEAARMQAEQAIADANQARMDAATTAMSANNQAANSAAANAAMAAQAAADRADAAARAANTPPTIVVQSAPAPASDTSEPLVVPESQ